MNKNILGEKIRKMRKMRQMTQEKLSGSKITRNMLSQIENGIATPSIETLEYIANTLEVPIEYLVSSEDNLAEYIKKEKISDIYRAYSSGNYRSCVDKIKALRFFDNELNFILASSYAALGKEAMEKGALKTAISYLESAVEHSSLTQLDTTHIEAKIAIYISIAKNIQSPLLEFDTQKYTASLLDSVDFEFYKYIIQDASYTFVTPTYALHIEGKKHLKEGNYKEALSALLNAAEFSKKDNYNAFVIFSIYTDIEYCYKQLYNFEKAYLYSTKRMTLLDNFKS
jgi:transcriptional regulator with XRE-family HTH domain